MSGALQRKLRNYLEAKKVLQAHYQSVRESAAGQDVESKENIEALHEFDQLSYSYHAIKSYYELSKSEWPFADRQPFESFLDLMPKVEDKLLIPELCAQYQGLQVLRKQWYESAKDGGKIANMMMSSSENPEDLNRYVKEVFATLDSLPVPDTMGNSLKGWSPSQSQKQKKNSSKPAHAVGQNEKPPMAISQSVVGNSVATKEPISERTSTQIPKPSGSPMHESLIDLRERVSGSANIPRIPPPSLSAAGRKTKLEHESVKVSTKDSSKLKNHKRPQSRVPDSIQYQDETSPDAEFVDSPAQKKYRVSLASHVSQSPVEADDSSQDQSSNTKAESSQRSSGINESTRPQASINSMENISVARISKPLTAALLDFKISPENGSSSKQDPASARYLDQNTEYIRGRASSSPIHSASKTSRESNGRSSPKPSRESNAKSVPQDKSSFAQFSTWSKDFVRCIVNAAASQPNSPAEAIQASLEDKCKILIRKDEAEMLRSHYGLRPDTMANYEYFIQAFHIVARQFSEQRSRYVTMPWAEMRTQFTRATQLQLEDWDIRARYHLFLLHLRVYGKGGEPSSNYKDEIESFRRRIDFRNSSTFLKSKTKTIPNSPPRQPSPKLSSIDSDSFTPPSVTTSDSVWTPEVFQALVDGYCLFEPQTRNKLLVLIEYIGLKTNTRVDFKSLLEKSRSKEFLEEVRKRLPEENETSISKLDPNVSPVSDGFDIIISNMIAGTPPDSYYSTVIKQHHLTEFWDLAKTKCIMSTVEYASKIDASTKVPFLKVIRAKILLYIRRRLLREHSVNVQEDIVSRRVVRMMEMDMFDESQCLLLNEIIHRDR